MEADGQQVINYLQVDAAAAAAAAYWHVPSTLEMNTKRPFRFRFTSLPRIEPEPNLWASRVLSTRRRRRRRRSVYTGKRPRVCV